MKTQRAALTVLLLLTCGAAPAGDKPALRIYLPRTVSVSADTIRLGAVSVVRSPDKDLAQKAEAVTLGRCPWPRERIVIDRHAILSRLASCGVKTANVRIDGADAVAVTASREVVAADKLLGCAESYLRSHPPAPGAAWRVVRPPAAMDFPAGEQAKLHARIVKGAPPNHVKVKVAATRDGREVGASAVLFRLLYRTRRAVATRPVAPGEAITPANAKVETVMTPQPPEGNWAPPFGMVSAARLLPGAVIRPGLVRPARQAVVVRRNQSVIMRIEAPGFTLTGLGLALQDGRPGQCIKVRNVDSKRIIVAEVKADGAVAPVFEESKP